MEPAADRTRRPTPRWSPYIIALFIMAGVVFLALIIWGGRATEEAVQQTPGAPAVGP